MTAAGFLRVLVVRSRKATLQELRQGSGKEPESLAESFSNLTHPPLWNKYCTRIILASQGEDAGSLLGFHWLFGRMLTPESPETTVSYPKTSLADLSLEAQ